MATDELSSLQEKHVETAKLLLGQGKELNAFVSRLLDDIGNLKAMLHAISIGTQDEYPALTSCKSSVPDPDKGPSVQRSIKTILYLRSRAHFM